MMKVVPRVSSWTCKRCGRTLPWTDEFFHSRQGTPNGLSYTCKDCVKEKNAICRVRIKERDGATRVSCRECGKEFWKSAGRDDPLCSSCLIRGMGPGPKHGLSKHPLYGVWAGMKTRCHNESDPGYKNYGGRGIRVCDEWTEFVPFYEWAVGSGWEPGLTIERLDVNLGYSPENCSWTPLSDQPHNRRNTIRATAWGETKALGLWLRDPRAVCRNRCTVLDRLERGATPEEALTAPVQEKRSLTDEDKAKALAMRKSGTSMTRIAQEFGVAQPTVKRFLASVGAV